MPHSGPPGRGIEGREKRGTESKAEQQAAYGGGGAGGADEGEEDDGGGEGARVLHRGRPGRPRARLALAFAAAGHDGSRSRCLSCPNWGSGVACVTPAKGPTRDEQG